MRALTACSGTSPLTVAGQSYLRRLPTTLSYVQQDAVLRFIRRGQSVGWFGDHTAIWLLCGGSLNSCLINLCGPKFSSGSINGGVSFQPYTGVKFDGTTGYINPGIQWTDIADATLNQHGMWVYINYEQTLTSTVLGATSGGNAIGIRPRNGNNVQIFDGSSNTTISVAASTAIGFTGLFRNNSSNVIVNKRGSETTVTLAAPTAWPSTAPALGRLGINGATFDPSQVVMYGFLGGATTLNSADLRADLVVACDELAVAIGSISSDELNPQPEVISSPHVWGASTINSVTPAGLRVMQQSPPPTSTSTNLNFALFPGSDFGTTQIGKLVSSTYNGVNGHAWVWGMRANYKVSNQANPIFQATFTVPVNGIEKQAAMEFSTYDYADACTLSHLAYHTGMPAHNGSLTGYLDYLNVVGLSDSAWIPYATAAANPTAYFNRAPTNANPRQRVSLDLVEPVAKLSEATMSKMKKGILIDGEWADLRSSSQLRAFSTKAAGIIRAGGMESTMYLNSWNAGNAQNEGLYDPTTVASIYNDFDWICPVVWPSNIEKNVEQSMLNQLNLLPSNCDMSKVCLTIGIGPYKGQLTSQDATMIRSFITGSHPFMNGRQIRMINWWRCYGLPGGDITRQYNQILAIVMGLPTS